MNCIQCTLGGYLMNTIIKRAYGKLNLSLDIVGKREDGYHLVCMVMQTVDLYDELTIQKTDKPGIQLTTDRPDLPTNEDNLIYKAAKLLFDEFQIKGGVSIHLKKQIPVAAGMAGGSADCAATLLGINTLFDLKLTEQDLQKRAVTMGADIPYCIMGGTALSEGIGEVLTPISPVPDCHVLLVKPNIDISTKWVYQTLRWNTLTSHPDTKKMLSALEAQSLSEVSSTMENVLETVTIPAYPVIASIKEKLLSLGAINAMMSGSGPTVFGLFPEQAAGEKAYSICKELYPDYQVEWTRFISREEIKNK